MNTTNKKPKEIKAWGLFNNDGELNGVVTSRDRARKIKQKDERIFRVNVKPI